MLIYIAVFSLMLSFGTFARSRIATAAFVLAVVVFVSLRFETGFDWPVYKTVFRDFQDQFELGQLMVYQHLYSQEGGFLLFAGSFSSLLPNYEAFQATISLLFLFSIWRLSLAVGVARFAMVLALALSYLLLTVGFSTVRQSMAIAVFNFGLIAMLRNRCLLGALLFTLSVSVQISASLYVAAFAIARAFLLFHHTPRLGAMIGIVAIVPTVLYVVLPFAAGHLPFLSDRYAFYTSHFADVSGVGLWGMGFYIAFLTISAHVSYPFRKPSVGASEALTLQSMVVVLCAFSLSSEHFPIIRDRSSYEMWILYSILLSKGHLRFRWEARLAAFSFGAFFTFLNVLSYPGRLAFIPYQNAIGCVLSACEDSGSDRQSQMKTELDAALGH